MLAVIASLSGVYKAPLEQPPPPPPPEVAFAWVGAVQSRSMQVGHERREVHKDEKTCSILSLSGPHSENSPRILLRGWSVSCWTCYSLDISVFIIIIFSLVPPGGGEKGRGVRGSYSKIQKGWLGVSEKVWARVHWP